ncbi:hypothetical protein BACCAC_03605 [Bacteroides caccae ATCC 43185]|nr:hypothetical protein BACCAC_03605 [Bacteroides caccae ATCC 43185]
MLTSSRNFENISYLCTLEKRYKQMLFCTNKNLGLTGFDSGQKW